MASQYCTVPPTTGPHAITAIITVTLFSVEKLEKQTQISLSRRESNYVVPVPSASLSPDGLIFGWYDLGRKQGKL